jgi:polar amino acid transport system substrate-binding protein
MVCREVKPSAVRRYWGSDSASQWLCSGVLLLCALPLWTSSVWAQPGTVPAATPPVTLQLCYERIDIPPWRMVDGRGLNLDLIRMAAARSGVAVQFVTLPWKRCLSEMRDGAVQGVFAASFSADRMAFGAYPGGNSADAAMQLHTDGFSLVRRKGDAASWDGKTLSGLKGPVGVQIGYSVANDLRKLGIAVDESSQTAKELLQKLQLGRVGAAAIGNSDVQTLLGDSAVPGAFSGAIEVMPVPLVQKPYFLMLSHQFVQDAPVVSARLWQDIAVVRRSPEYQKLVRDGLAGRKP